MKRLTAIVILALFSVGCSPLGLFNPLETTLKIGQMATASVPLRDQAFSPLSPEALSSGLEWLRWLFLLGLVGLYFVGADRLRGKITTQTQINRTVNWFLVIVVVSAPTMIISAGDGLGRQLWPESLTFGYILERLAWPLLSGNILENWTIQLAVDTVGLAVTWHWVWELILTIATIAATIPLAFSGNFWILRPIIIGWIVWAAFSRFWLAGIDSVGERIAQGSYSGRPEYANAAFLGLTWVLVFLTMILPMLINRFLPAIGAPAPAPSAKASATASSGSLSPDALAAILAAIAGFAAGRASTPAGGASGAWTGYPPRRESLPPPRRTGGSGGYRDPGDLNPPGSSGSVIVVPPALRPQRQLPAPSVATQEPQPLPQGSTASAPSVAVLPSPQRFQAANGGTLPPASSGALPDGNAAGGVLEVVQPFSPLPSGRKKADPAVIEGEVVDPKDGTALNPPSPVRALPPPTVSSKAEKPPRADGSPKSGDPSGAKSAPQAGLALPPPRTPFQRHGKAQEPVVPNDTVVSAATAPTAAGATTQSFARSVKPSVIYEVLADVTDGDGRVIAREGQIIIPDRVGPDGTIFLGGDEIPRSAVQKRKNKKGGDVW